MKPRHTCRLAWTVVLAVPGSHLFAGYEPVEPREPKPDGIPITEPGTYAKAGATYVLTADIASPRSAIFLGKDVTLDLNGHTISYADGGYEQVPNRSFEEGLEHWDTSKATGAPVKGMRWQHPLVGEKVCILPEGQEIVSEYLSLPGAFSPRPGTSGSSLRTSCLSAIMPQSSSSQSRPSISGSRLFFCAKAGEVSVLPSEVRPDWEKPIPYAPGRGK